jgi:HAD superfamily hydrolase (TIGR01490 family)
VTTIDSTTVHAENSAADGGRPAAFFDLDRTLIAGSSGLSVLREMRRIGVISRSQLLRDAWVGIRFRLWGIDDATTEAVRIRVGGYITGIDEKRLARISAPVLQRVLPRVYPAVLARAHAHQDAGEPVYLVTASTQEFADLFARVFAFDGALGSRSEIVGGKYTGQPGGPFMFGEGKAEAMRELAEQDGLDLAASTAYSDAISDLPMLRAVGTQVAVNPEKSLREIADQEGWEVLAVDRLKRRAGLTGLGLVGVLGALGAVGRRAKATGK